jgi:hypothetical protein
MKPRGPLLAAVSAVALCAAIAGCSSARDAQRPAAAQSPTAAPQRNAALEGLLAAATRKLRETVPPGFAIRVVRPFVVVSDEPAEVVDRRVGRVVEPAIAWLELTYFHAEPPSVIAIWICADAASYERTARSLTGAAPSTPFGFYSDEHGAIVLDASTGDGTLVHEIVHPFVRADFPACPTWLDEGLGSLYERCVFEGGSLRGLVNWRLDALQRAATEGRVPAISALVHMTPDAFYGDSSPLNYAAARHLCLWLQERGALAELYRRLRDGAVSSSDPSADAEKAIVELLGVESVADADTAFRAWVMGLSDEGSPL